MKTFEVYVNGKFQESLEDIGDDEDADSVRDNLVSNGWPSHVEVREVV